MGAEQYVYQTNALDKIFKNFSKLHLQIHRNVIVIARNDSLNQKGLECIKCYAKM